MPSVATGLPDGRQSADSSKTLSRTGASARNTTPPTVHGWPSLLPPRHAPWEPTGPFPEHCGQTSVGAVMYTSVSRGTRALSAPARVSAVARTLPSKRLTMHTGVAAISGNGAPRVAPFGVPGPTAPTPVHDPATGSQLVKDTSICPPSTNVK